MPELRRSGWATALLVSVVLLAPAAAPADPYPIDCEGPAPEAEPGADAWFVRDTNNLYCGQQRHLDQAQHPPWLVPGRSVTDDYRRPELHDGVRFRYLLTEIGGNATEIYYPCAPGTCTAPPEELTAHAPPYPAVIQLHGGGSRKELHWWSSQSLAEMGYIVIVPDGAGQAVARAALDALFDPSDARFTNFDREPVGIAGHSIGGDAASIVAHTDQRIGAYVGWDRAGLSSPDDEVRGDAPPSLHINGDYGCAAPLVCPPEPRSDYPDPADRGAKGLDFDIARAHGVDTMVVWLRAALHFDWVPSELSGNRYVELLNIYYMGAWYDRYLKGDSDPVIAADAFERLTSSVFDASADVHNISQGFYDHAAALAAGDLSAGNVPYAIAGMPVDARLSFYYDSRCFITAPGSGARAESDDIRTSGCSIP